MAGGLGVFNQIRWPGVGDADDCWVISTLWALVASGRVTKENLPSVRAFRDAAGVPDVQGRKDGGSNAQILKALQKLEPGIDAKLYSSNNVVMFRAWLSKGYIADLAVNSGALPKYLQFGFTGLHQISVVMQGGKYYVMNPLAQEGSALLEITEQNLMKAAFAFLKDGRLHGVLIKAGSIPSAKIVAPVIPAAPTVIVPIITHFEDFMDGYAIGRFYRKKHSGTVRT
jgi:hypothetical protein